MRKRTIREAHSVTDKVFAESGLYPRLEDAFDALTWWLARHPDDGELIDDLHWLYKQAGNVELNIPSLSVIYTFDADTVDIMHLLVRLPPL